MGSKFTRYDLQEITDYIGFEFFCHDLMSREGYKDIEPLGGFKDKGRDAIHHDGSKGAETIFTYSVRDDWQKKLNEDLNKVRKHRHPCDNVVFTTTCSLTAGEKDKAKQEVRNKYGWRLEIYDLERITILVDNQYQALRSQHPNIFVVSLNQFNHASLGKDLDKKEYAKYLLALHEEWLERYTPLLAEHREIDTYVTRVGSRKAATKQIPVRKISEAARVSLLLGESGSGKTTGLWRIIVEKSKAILEGKSEKIPIMMSLRGWGFNHKCRELVQDQFDLIDVSQEAVEAELKHGNCLVLIDGLNELSPMRRLRAGAYQDLQRFLSRYQENTFVICCRSADYEYQMLDPERLGAKVRSPKAYEIRRMSKDQIVDYVWRYFKDDRGSAEDLLCKLDVFNEDLWEDKKSIIQLARIPLYLQLFILEYERSRALPNNQARLLRALINRTLDREKARQAAAIDSFSKERLLSGFAYGAVLGGHWLRLPEYLARDLFEGQVQRLKNQSLIHSDLTVGAVWQEVVSNNFLNMTGRGWVEWLHQLICDYFLGCHIAHLWNVGTNVEKEELLSTFSTSAWAQACGIALGLLDEERAATFVEALISLNEKLAQQAFEAQIEEDQREVCHALVSEIIAEGNPKTDRLKSLATKLPSRVVIQTLIDSFDVCKKQMELPIVTAISALMFAHSAGVLKYRLHGLEDYAQTQYYERLSSAVQRATTVLTAWTNNRNELVSFEAAKGIWEQEKDLAARTFKKLLKSGTPEVVRLVRNLIEEWGIE